MRDYMSLSLYEVIERMGLDHLTSDQARQLLEALYDVRSRRRSQYQKLDPNGQRERDELVSAVTVSETTLEPLRYGVRRYLEYLTTPGVDPNVKVMLLEAECENIVISARAEVWAEQIDRIREQWPADWWQAFKDRWAPSWFLRRWPIEYRVIEIDVKRLWPEIEQPEALRFHPLRVDVKRMLTLNTDGIPK